MNIGITVPTKVMSSLAWPTNPEQVRVEVHFVVPTCGVTIIMWSPQGRTHAAQGTWTLRKDRLHISLLELESTWPAMHFFHLFGPTVSR